MNTYVRTYDGAGMVDGKRRQKRSFDSAGLELGPDGRRYNRIRGAPQRIKVRCAAMRGQEGKSRCRRPVYTQEKTDGLCWQHWHWGCAFGRFDDDE